jgi:hypothetical protein
MQAQPVDTPQERLLARQDLRLALRMHLWISIAGLVPSASLQLQCLRLLEVSTTHIA